DLATYAGHRATGEDGHAVGNRSRGRRRAVHRPRRRPLLGPRRRPAGRARRVAYRARPALQPGLAYLDGSPARPGRRHHVVSGGVSSRCPAGDRLDGVRPGRVGHPGQPRDEAAAAHPLLPHPGRRPGTAEDRRAQRAISASDRTARRAVRGNAAPLPASSRRNRPRHGALRHHRRGLARCAPAARRTSRRRIRFRAGAL
ncbi:MAG: Acetyltransferase, GNAT family, partial [uncultured Nocardioidaceae bacterium]